LNKKIKYRPQHRCLEMENATAINQAYSAVVTNDFNYDAWGLSIETLFNPTYSSTFGSFNSPNPQRHRYNGKEQITSSRFYDYGARQYDPVIGRWLSVDPLAEEGKQWSSYVYTFNNPLGYTDPDGRWPWPSWSEVKKSANFSFENAKNVWDKISISHFAKLEMNVTAGARVVSNTKTPIPIGVKKIDEIDVNARSTVHAKFVREEDKNGFKQEIYKSGKNSSKANTSIAFSSAVPIEGIPFSFSASGKIESTYENKKETLKSYEYSAGISLTGLGINITKEKESNLKTAESKNTFRVSFFSVGLTLGGGIVTDAQDSSGIKIEY
jgi:RHS repeat-associated protein